MKKSIPFSVFATIAPELLEEFKAEKGRPAPKTIPIQWLREHAESTVGDAVDAFLAEKAVEEYPKNVPIKWLIPRANQASVECRQRVKLELVRACAYAGFEGEGDAFQLIVHPLL